VPRNSIDALASHKGLGQGGSKAELHHKLFSSQYQTLQGLSTQYATAQQVSSSPPRDQLAINTGAATGYVEEQTKIKPGSPYNLNEAMVKVQH
jgi:hypothetical protein